MKIIFNALSPTYGVSINGKEISNGDVVEVNEAQYDYYVNIVKVAIPHTEKAETQINRLIKSADKKRKQILDKMNKLERRDK